MAETQNFGLPDLEPVTLGWLAGLLEGEGCFGVSRHRGKYMSPNVVVAMTDRDVIERVAALWGKKTRIHPTPAGQKTAFVTQVSGVTAVRWMLRLQPMLGKRRSTKVQSILAEWKEYTLARVVDTSTGVLRYSEADREFVLKLLGVTKTVGQLLAEREERNRKKDADRVRRYREEHPERWLETWRSSHARNASAIRQRRLDYYWRNVDKSRERSREYRKKNHAARLAYDREYKKTHRDRLNQQQAERRRLARQEIGNG